MMRKVSFPVVFELVLREASTLCEEVASWFEVPSCSSMLSVATTAFRLHVTGLWQQCMACNGLHPLPGLDQVTTNPVSSFFLGCNGWDLHTSLSEIGNVALCSGFLFTCDKTHTFSGGPAEVYQDPFQETVLWNVFGERQFLFQEVVQTL